MKRWSFLVFSLLLMGFSFLIWKNEWIHLRQVDVKLKSQLNSFKDLESKSLSSVEKFKGQFLYGLSLKSIDKELKKDPRVKSVNISRYLPDRLEVEVIPHSPIAMVLGAKQKLFPVARDASLLPALSKTEHLDLPVVRGKVFRKNKSLRNELVSLLLEVPDKGVLSQSNISEVKYKKNKGFVVYLIEPQVVVRLGEKPFVAKIDRVERVLNYMKTQKLKGRVIDARLGKKVVVKMRNQL